MTRSKWYVRGTLIGLILMWTILVPRQSAGSVGFPVQTCTDYPANPVLNNTGVYYERGPGVNLSLKSFATHYDYPSVIRRGSSYLMWFSGAVNNVTGIFFASSDDGIKWNVNGAPVLRPGAAGSWDSGVVYAPNVLWNGSLYLMYYVGTGTNSFRQIGVAFSPEGIIWAKYVRNPVLVAGPEYYDSWYGRFPSVLLDGGRYKMWYVGHSLVNQTGNQNLFYIAIDYATSNDGVHWTKYPGNPVYGGGLSWTDHYVLHPSVIKINDTYVMVGDDSRGITYLASSDGINWVNSTSLLVASPKVGWDNSSVNFPSVLPVGSELLIWYVGFSSSPHQGLSTGVGFARCALLLLSTTKTVTATATSVTTSTSTSFQTRTVTATLTITSTTTLPLLGSPVWSQGLALGGALVAFAFTIGLIVLRLARKRGATQVNGS